MMSRVLLSLGLALFVGLSTVSAQDAAKKERPKKPAAEKKEKVKKPPLTEAQKAERDKKRAAAMEKRFKALDKDGDKALTLDEFTAVPQRKRPAAKKKEDPTKPALTDAQKAELAKKRAEAQAKRFKTLDKNGDQKLTFEEFTAKPERKRPAKKDKPARKKPAKK